MFAANSGETVLDPPTKQGFELISVREAYTISSVSLAKKYPALYPPGKLFIQSNPQKYCKSIPLLPSLILPSPPLTSPPLTSPLPTLPHPT